MKWVLATGNPGKVSELAAMLAPLSIDLVAQSEYQVSEVAETGTTFVENAIIKARHAAALTGLPAVADDSGLEVDALHGAPGVYSSRYAGEHASDHDNVVKLLAELDGVATEQRTARFRCVLVFMRHANDPTPLICQGSWRGKIALSADGDGGFGYDPVFIAEGLDVSAAQLSKADKNAISHRGQALKQLVAQLPDFLAHG
ncbi:RdgB/HAM1 family non-canonical purine NTP pyrophosphatase [Neiella sp. HB171785]|uniref:dITP/XTP pyrophosphatase n=1 Tax=Neiella litorisoli TaxID=2771431 RepID=A0A8J6UDW8_9GAMM|nr:RdgB/HAM1 family non-canonical purine NTP pyrophosphatase [Neiella litorisoli]MBD1388724.1 RdgB/HAM1 family non-canonical purine NTP pyrophosphatase [Neiella litorisoli]